MPFATFTTGMLFLIIYNGLKGPDVYWTVYMSAGLLASWQAGEVEKVRWVIKNRYGNPQWCENSELQTSEILFKTTDAAAQILATQQGLGMTLLPCFVGDADPLLVRAPSCEVKMKGAFWVLTHGDTRKTKRVRLFTDFIAKRLAEYGPLIGGHASSSAASVVPTPSV